MSSHCSAAGRWSRGYLPNLEWVNLSHRLDFGEPFHCGQIVRCDANIPPQW